MAATLNWLDRAIGYVSPTAGFRRARARYLSQILTGARGAYEGASKTRRLDGWRAQPTSANAETRGQLMTLRDRSRDLVRNNPYAARAVAVIAHNTVGAGIIPQVKSRSAARQKRMETLVRAWMDTTLCDADGRHTLYGLQRLAMRTVAESGEVLIRRRRRRPTDGLPVPLQLQVLEPDFLDTSKDGPLPDGGAVIQGVEVNAIGRRVAYWLHDEHPGDLRTRLRMGPSRRIPADEILHIYRQDRPGQVRGVPWGAPVIVRLRDFADFDDAQLVRQKIAACFAVFVHGEDPTDINVSSTDTEHLIEELSPGIVEKLPPGKDVSFAVPPGVTGYAEYSRVQLTAIASGYGVPYEALTGDLSNVNFSSGRMGWLEFARCIEDWRWNMLIPQMCDGVWQWFTEAVSLTDSMGDLTVEWTPPRREMIDPKSEIASIRDAVRSGLMSLSEAIRQHGYDPDVVFEEIAADNARMDALGIITDSDPRHGKAAQRAMPDQPAEE